jgi:uncharacterized repeat protein (TIGR03803 family)
MLMAKQPCRKRIVVAFVMAGLLTIVGAAQAASETVLYCFGEGASDGINPYAGLIYLNGTLYGATPLGGTYGGGTVFSITPAGVEKALYAFGSSSTDGFNAYAGLISVNGTLYGTTVEGGTYGLGTAFSITPAGVEKVLHAFGGSPDGSQPYASLVNVNGTLYGTTRSGGSMVGNAGTVFSIAPSGIEKVVYAFGGSPDGSQPYGRLLNVNGTLYGTTVVGGAYDQGTVFLVTPQGVEKLLHSFGSSSRDGVSPYAGLTYVNGSLYGTTFAGGAYGLGTVFSITPQGEKVLHAFGSSGDGTNPYAALINVNGTLYGTTYGGGTYGGGTVYSITPQGVEKVLYAFGSASSGALNPYAGLIDVNGTFYGTTVGGGCAGFYFQGAVFSITP